jgi:hypothetical protein
MPRRLRAIPLVLAVLVLAAAAADPALAASGSPTADCNANGRLSQHYTPTQLRQALATMPADIKEYTNCFDLIQRTLLSELGQIHGSGSGGGGGSLLPTPVLIVLVLLLLSAAGLGALALRRRQCRRRS